MGPDMIGFVRTVFPFMLEVVAEQDVELFLLADLSRHCVTFGPENVNVVVSAASSHKAHVTPGILSGPYTCVKGVHVIGIYLEVEDNLKRIAVYADFYG